MCEYCGVQSHQCNVTPMEATFCGIPIPLTMETLLDVYRRAVTDRTGMAERQAETFRDRILRMFEVMESEREMWRLLDFAHCEEKDARIAELERQIEGLRSMREGVE